MSRNLLRRIEVALLIVGSLFMAIVVAAYIHRATMSRVALTQFHELKHELKKEQQADKPSRSLADRQFKLDFTLWSPERVAGYEQSLAEMRRSPFCTLPKSASRRPYSMEWMT